MPLNTFPFTTGPATLPDVGELSYNGCEFSPLFETNVSGTCVKDVANRTIKYMEYNIKVDGYVTLPDGPIPTPDGTSIAPTMATLRRLLTEQGGELTYKGRGCDIVSGGNIGIGTQDIAWGPIPELLEFQPLGGGLSAKIQWQVKVRIPEIPKGNGLKSAGGLAAIPLLQFNYETTVSYGDDGFSKLGVRGILEIPLARQAQEIRTLMQTADDMRKVVENQVMVGIDLGRFRMTSRNFNLSRDKRTLEWDFQAEEKPYMDMPPGCTVARGTYSVRPAKAGMGLCRWLCTLRATYTVRPDEPRRLAWLSFLALLRLRMAASQVGPNPALAANQQPPRGRRPNPLLALLFAPDAANALLNPVGELQGEDKAVKETRRAFLMDFSIDEGLYLDSKTTTFSATWTLVTFFNQILLGSGIWKKLPEKDQKNNSRYAILMKDINGTQSWLANKVDPNLDIVVDFGS